MVKDDLKTNDDDKGIIGTLLEHYKQDNDKNIKEINIMLCFQDLILAGTSTTAHSTHAFINIMVNYPKVFQKLQAEVDEVVGVVRPITMQDRNQMPYTRATILELLRYTSVVAMGVLHGTLVETEINGHIIEKGTPVATNLWAMHHDEDFWKDPFVFRPERFLDSDNQILAADHPNRKHLMPFGGGIRVCLGESLAQGRLFLLITTLAQVFDIEEGTIKVSADPRQYITGTTLASPDYDVRLIPRNHLLYN
jgi:cytochrome P450